MAANKFATMLHKNTHRITVILVYAVLEWVLIFLLLLNSLFSFLITKYANYFGLKPPCLWCSRIDQILEPNNRNNSYRDLVCESHATEISKLGFCPSHQKLVEPQKLCKNCSSKKTKIVENSIEIARRIGFFTLVGKKSLENFEENSKCSCCDENLSNNFCPSFLLFKPSWCRLGYPLKRDLTAEAIDEENNEGEISDTSNSDSFLDQCDSDHEVKEKKEEEEAAAAVDDDDDVTIIQAYCGEDESINLMNVPPQISGHSDVYRLIPISVIDSSTMEAEATSHLVSKVAEERLNGIMKQSGEEEEHDSQILMGDDRTQSEILTFMDKRKFEALPGPEISETSNIDQGPQKIQKDCQEINHHLSTISDLSRADEPWDGSVISEMENSEGILTVEKLKSALKAEHNALIALYAELEEERSAAAVAASQTMAMITRLQEEKAAMQMEALQYQRMMEEQSEYDQEALQLLNELMIKREREKQELEREVEFYHKKVLDYEAKVKKMMIKTKDVNDEETDELSIDLNHESYDNTVIDGVMNFEDMGKDLSSLDDSLAEFDEERVSILEELKALEEKLFTLADVDEEHVSDNYGFYSPRENGGSNGEDFSESNDMDSKVQNLLPLCDANEFENEEGIEENSVDSKFEVVNKKLGIEEEVDHVYERLQALETDREFLKHCFSSLKKGDKGMDLLHEILQHFRDLKTVELQARNACDSPLS